MRDNSWILPTNDKNDANRRQVDSWMLPMSSKNDGNSHNRNINTGAAGRSPRAPVDSWAVPLNRKPSSNGPRSPPVSSNAIRATEQCHDNMVESDESTSPTYYHHNNSNGGHRDPNGLNTYPPANAPITPPHSTHMQPFQPKPPSSNDYNYPSRPDYRHNAAGYSATREPEATQYHQTSQRNQYQEMDEQVRRVPTPQLSPPSSSRSQGSQRRYLNDDNNDEEHGLSANQYKEPRTQRVFGNASTPVSTEQNATSLTRRPSNGVGLYGQPYRTQGSLYSEAGLPVNAMLQSAPQSRTIQATPIGATSNRWVSHTAEDLHQNSWRDQPASPVPPPFTESSQYPPRAAPPAPIATHNHYHPQQGPISPHHEHASNNPITSPTMPMRDLHSSTAPISNSQPYMHPMPTYMGSKADRKSKRGRSFCSQFFYMLFCCCCFRSCCATRRGCCCTTLIILCVLGAIVALAGYFLWPRVPDVQFVNASMSTLNPSNQAVGEQPELPTWKNGTVSMNVAFVLNVKSENYISLRVNNITVNGYLSPTNMGNLSKSATANTASNNKTSNTTRIPVGYGSLPSEITFPGRASTNFKLYFLLSFNTNQQEQIPAFYEFIDACGVTGNAKRKLLLEYDAKVDLAIVSSLGIRPAISNSIKLDCPYEAGVLVQMPQVRTLIRSIGPQFGLSSSRISTILAGHEDTTKT